MVGVNLNNNHLEISIGKDEAYSVLSILLHAKFGFGPQSKIYSHQYVNLIIEGLISFCDEVKFEDFELNLTIDDISIGADPAFAMIYKQVKEYNSVEMNENFNYSIFPYKIKQ